MDQTRRQSQWPASISASFARANPGTGSRSCDGAADKLVHQFAESEGVELEGLRLQADGVAIPRA